jgi:hypothetical protein
MSIFAVEWSYIAIAGVLAVALVGVLLVPFLIKEIRDGKRDLGRMRRWGPQGTVRFGPETPTGAGDNKPGRVGNPAPGMPDAQADPYSELAQRHAPPTRS